MRIEQNSTIQAPNFGMRFRLKRINAARDAHGTDAAFINEYQLNYIKNEVLRLEPQEDEFVLNLGYPKYESDKTRPLMKSSYQMFVDIISADKPKKTVDLSENELELRYTSGINRLEIHPQGPFHKLVDFIDDLVSEKVLR